MDVFHGFLFCLLHYLSAISIPTDESVFSDLAAQWFQNCIFGKSARGSEKKLCFHCIVPFTLGLLQIVERSPLTQGQ